MQGVWEKIHDFFEYQVIAQDVFLRSLPVFLFFEIASPLTSIHKGRLPMLCYGCALRDDKMASLCRSIKRGKVKIPDYYPQTNDQKEV